MHEETLKKIVQDAFGKINTETIAKIQERYEKEIKELKEAFRITKESRDKYAESCRKLEGERDSLILDKKQLREDLDVSQAARKYLEDFCSKRAIEYTKTFNENLNLIKENERLRGIKAPKQFQEYFTIRRFNEKYDIKMPSERASVLGKLATKLSKEARIEVKKEPDWQYGEVNSYREDVLLFVYAEEIKKCDNKLFGREKQILENYEKIKEQILSRRVVLPEAEGDAEKVGVVSAKFTLISEIELEKIIRDFFERGENYKISVETFHNYCQKYGLKVSPRDLVLLMGQLGFKASRRRYFGARKMCFIGLRVKL